MSAPELDAVLWDMDGTLVDTEPYWFKAELELLGYYGVPWTLEQSKQLVGNALPKSAAVLQEFGVPLDRREIIDRLTESVVRQVQVEVPWRPGARELLEQLHAAGIPLGLVTMSETKLVDEVVARLPEDTFAVQVTGTSVVHGKPEPDAYLLGAQKLVAHNNGRGELRVDNMVAIEDSLPGVTSALAAGLVTLGVPNIVPLDPQPGLTIWSTLADRSVADLQTLLNSSRLQAHLPPTS
jgi:HAD superfamily hydrolase (TIGR01509 family)